MKKLAIGEDDFKVFRQNDNYFVDKSLFVEEIIDDASRVLLFPRSRETTETALEAALKQIEDRQYEAALRQQGCTSIMKVAVTFDGKRVFAKQSEQ